MEIRRPRRIRREPKGASLWRDVEESGMAVVEKRGTGEIGDIVGDQNCEPPLEMRMRRHFPGKPINPPHGPP